MQTFDLAIIGTGAAGLTASIFASRYQLSNVIFGTLWGGEIANAYLIENYPGFASITGAELTNKLVEQVRGLGADIRPDTVTKITRSGEEFDIETISGQNTRARSVILGMGLRRRHLNVPGEDRLAGRGVSYCATCDAAFFKGKVTAVVGGGDAALTAALHLAELSPKVYVLVRKDVFRGEPIWQKQVQAHPNVEILFETQAVEVLGDQSVTGLKLSVPYKGQDVLAVEGVFVEIGANPDAHLARDLGVEVDEKGFIKVDENMRTTSPMVYGAGDVTDADAHFDQIISAQAQGGLAARSAFYDLKKTSEKHSSDPVPVPHETSAK